MRNRKPVIGVPADRRLLGNHWFHCVGEKYLAAIAEASGALPLIVPAFGERLELELLLERCDGVLLTGSPSNVEPHHYAGPPSAPGTWHDPERDATTLPLIPRAVAAGLPLLAICRGFQELNVAYGGTLHQKLHEIPGHLMHKEDETQPLEVQYGEAHDIRLTRGGLLARIAGREQIRVNSLHSQGIDRLGNGLAVEGRAPDGVIEAVSVENAPGFAVAVQWHPEWQVLKNDFSKALFAAFGEAARARARGPAAAKVHR
ncbi:MAG TPA: gamma-glutamyl-gamma-aminobutyrate hydrolase family protein [Steroidobacteraceae bacterium]|nr:gamma-glutamyl-gamma-aminobutyrate hydrolase family protein [Steroidobacteraceae bacterium]